MKYTYIGLGVLSCSLLDFYANLWTFRWFFSKDIEDRTVKLKTTYIVIIYCNKSAQKPHRKREAPSSLHSCTGGFNL